MAEHLALYAPALAYSGLFILGCFVLTLWLVSLALRDSSIVDIFWGPGCAAVAWVAWAASGSGSSHAVAAVLAATLWGLRLGAYIGLRNRGGEDRRYARLRQHISDQGKNYALYSLRAVFGMQGLFMWICTWPLIVAVVTPSTRAIGALGGVGLGLWAMGLIMETLADAQMSRFRAQRTEPGAVMDRGLWRYSRHPNYFGEMLVQWGLFLLACDVSRFGWLTVFGPLLLSYVIMGPLGANLLERRLGKKNPGYEAYIRRTSAFIPWPPKRG